MTQLSLRQASKTEIEKVDPQYVSPDGRERTWITRGGNFAVCLSRVEAGAVLERANHPEEFMVVLPPGGATATIEAGADTVEAREDSLTIVPPGASRIVVRTPGLFARIISRAAADIMAMACNADTYSDGAPELAPPDLWPEPRGGYCLRHYPLGRYAAPGGPRVQHRLFRSTNMMVNLFVAFPTRRDPSALTPHWHDDFEQASLCFEGTWIHHLRYNWGPDAALWRPDDHAEMGTPSVLIIPARTIHTSQDIGPTEGPASLYDIFSPPRIDFALKEGYCLNEDEYPLPEGLNASEVKTGGTLMDWQKAGRN